MLYGTTARMCNTTGSGRARNRAFAGVTSASPASSTSRAVPNAAGTSASRISIAGMRHSARPEDVVALMVVGSLGCWVAVAFPLVPRARSAAPLLRLRLSSATTSLRVLALPPPASGRKPDT
jgi:hypothetical protein